MQEKSLSTLGYILDFMNIQTVSMSRAIHVDASLVSKWKTGARNLSEKSIYFEDVIDYLLEQSKKTNHYYLENALMNFYPHESIRDDFHLESLLRQALSGKKTIKALNRSQFLSDQTKAVSSLVFEENSGKREAVKRLLDYAENMTIPGELIFVDAEEFTWLLEDNAFTEEFCSRIEALLQNGFRAKFIIHYSSYKERFIRLFSACSPLIFHRNVEWYYYQYYNENLFNISFFILNRAISLLSISSNGIHSTTTIFTDTSVVLRHEALVNHTLSQCSLVFHNFELPQLTEVIEGIYSFRKGGAFYAVLPAPVFITVKKDLLMEVLKNNDVSEKNIQKCLKINQELREITSSYFSQSEKRKDPFIYIFHLEKMISRATTQPFISRSLTLLSEKKIKILPRQYAQVLRTLADALNRHDNLQIVFLSEKDSISLPSINCWHKQNTWMLQMDKEGFRLSDELSIISAASTTIEHCIRSIPPIRREKESVRQYLLDLAGDLENESIE